MLKLFQGLSRWLANYTSIFVIGVAVFTFFFPHTLRLGARNNPNRHSRHYHAHDGSHPDHQ